MDENKFKDDVGDSGYGVLYNVEEEKIKLDQDVDFIMAIETGGADRLIENGFDEEFRWFSYQRATCTFYRRILKRMNEEWNLPAVVFADGDRSFRIFDQ